MGEAFEKKIKQDRPWNCPICGEEKLRHAACPTCQAELIRFVAPEPDERREGPLLRLSGRVRAVFVGVGTGARAPAGTHARDPDAWLASFKLELHSGELIVVACHRRTWTRIGYDQGHYLAALRPGAEVEVLARVEDLSPDLHGQPPPGADARLGARAQVVALGPEAEELLRRAARAFGEKGAGALDGQGEDVPDGLRVEQTSDPQGARQLTLTVRHELGDLFGPRLILPAAGAFVTLQILGVGGWRALPWALMVMGLAAPATYFWLAKINRRTIRIGPSKLSVEFAPLPWPGWEWPLDQLVEEDTYDADPPHASLASYRPDTLIAVRRDGRRRALLRGADEYQVRFAHAFIATVLDLDVSKIGD